MDSLDNITLTLAVFAPVVIYNSYREEAAVLSKTFPQGLSLGSLAQVVRPNAATVLIVVVVAAASKLPDPSVAQQRPFG